MDLKKRGLDIQQLFHRNQPPTNQPTNQPPVHEATARQPTTFFALQQQANTYPNQPPTW